MKKSSAGFIGYALLIVIGLIIFLAVTYTFLAKPYKIPGESILSSSGAGGYVFAEKISYLFGKPAVGDRVIFTAVSTDSDYIGIITKEENQKGVTVYTISSTGKGQPWTVSADKISGKIYYPPLDQNEAKKIVESLNITPTPTQKIDETANWKTYTNKGFAYSIQYPQNWVTATSSDVSPLVVLTNSASQTPALQDISVSIMVKDTNESFSKYLDSFLPEASWEKTSEDITVNGIKGAKWILKNPYAANNPGLAEVAFFPRQGKDSLFVYSIRIYGPTSASNLTNQILSTFQFIK